jgi:hypothetical protein
MGCALSGSPCVSCCKSPVTCLAGPLLHCQKAAGLVLVSDRLQSLSTMGKDSQNVADLHYT